MSEKEHEFNEDQMFAAIWKYVCTAATLIIMTVAICSFSAGGCDPDTPSVRINIDIPESSLDKLEPETVHALIGGALKHAE